MLIEKIPVTGETVANAIMATYPNGKINLDEIKKNRLYNYFISKINPKDDYGVGKNKNGTINIMRRSK